MAEDKRNRGDQQQGGNPNQQDRQRSNRDRKPGGGSMESPGSTETPSQDDEDQQK